MSERKLVRATVPMCPARGCNGELVKTAKSGEFLECRACRLWYEPSEANWGYLAHDIVAAEMRAKSSGVGPGQFAKVTPKTLRDWADRLDGANNEH